MKKYASNIKGHCHCGNIHFEFETNIPVDKLIIRNCQCRFCRLHGAATARDPEGRVVLRVDDLESVKLYRFETESTDFVLCDNCGVYVAAVVTDEGMKFATLNMNLTSLDISNAEPITHGDEPANSRVEKRVKSFTPLVSSPL